MNDVLLGIRCWLAMRWEAVRRAVRSPHHLLRDLLGAGAGLLATAWLSREWALIVGDHGMAVQVVMVIVVTQGWSTRAGVLLVAACLTSALVPASSAATANMLLVGEPLPHAFLFLGIAGIPVTLFAHTRRAQFRAETHAAANRRTQAVLHELVEQLATQIVEADRARLRAETASAAKSDFLAIVSHELRTPLTSILGYAELLDEGCAGPLAPEQADMVQRLHQCGTHLSGIIENILFLSKEGRATTDYAIREVALGEAIAEAAAMLHPQAQARHLTLDACAVTATALTVQADPHKLRQVLVNLIGNAIKFTPAGGRVTLGVTADDAMTAVTVADTGCGIPAHMLDRIFEPFVQVAAPEHRTVNGTGLGLPISREIAQRMGGTLTAASVLGQGSTFTLTVPRARPILTEVAAVAGPCRICAPSPIAVSRAA